jgi:hypothetical protein
MGVGFALAAFGAEPIDTEENNNVSMMENVTSFTSIPIGLFGLN